MAILISFSFRFETPIIIDYFFEERQDLRFLVLDVEDKSADISKKDFEGSLLVMLVDA